ncbi:MAG: helix-turn-helix transcriptional regulator [Nocardioidaceae bacterium]
MDFPRLVATAEIAELFGVSRQRAQQLQAHPTFPEPVASLRTGKIWRESDVVAWAKGRGRTVHPRAD